MTPQQLQEKINAASEEYYALSQELAQLASEENADWLEMKLKLSVDNPKVTNAEVDRHLGATEKGKRQKYLEVYLRGLEKIRAARILEFKSNSGIL